MTKYRLKDQDLQKALEKAAPGFSKALERDFGTTCDKNHSLIYVGVKDNDRNTYVEINIPNCWVEKIKEYDPDEWNSYPDVTPPEGELMRVEFNNLYGQVVRCCAIFCFGKWVNSTEHDVEVKDVFRFRPWEY